MQESYILQDEEHKNKLQECIDLLLAAGYFKVRIKSLDIFEKIVGGMMWCLSATDAEMDSSLLFMEYTNIREKIYVTQCIVKILKDLKCPYKIEPHQIQGYDVFNIYPVLQWLVKKSYAARKEMEFLNNEAAKWDFNHFFTKKFPIETESDLKFKELEFSGKLKFLFIPTRYYCKKRSFVSDSLKNSINATLREYSPSSEEFLTYENIESKPGDSKYRKLNLKENFYEIKSQVSTSHIAQLVEANAEKIAKIYQNYKEKNTNIDDSIQNFKNLPLSPKNQLFRMNKHLEELIEKYKKEKEEVARYDTELDSLKDAITNLLHKSSIDENEINQTKSVLSYGNENVDKIVTDVEKYLVLKECLSNNKSEYKNEIEALQGKLEELTKKYSSSQKREELVSTLTSLKHDHSAMKERIKLGQEAIAKRNRRLMMLKIVINDQPTISELSNFQKRFVELYSQMTLVHKETESYYELHSSLSEMVKLLVKEESIIKSIFETFPIAVKTSTGQIQFIQSLEKIIKTSADTHTIIENNTKISQVSYDEIDKKYKEVNAKILLYKALVRTFNNKMAALQSQ